MSNASTRQQKLDCQVDSWFGLFGELSMLIREQMQQRYVEIAL